MFVCRRLWCIIRRGWNRGESRWSSLKESLQLQSFAALTFLSYGRPDLPKMFNVRDNFRINRCPHVVGGDDDDVRFCIKPEAKIAWSKLKQKRNMSTPILSKTSAIWCSRWGVLSLFFYSCPVSLNPKYVISGFVKTKIYCCYIRYGDIVLMPWFSRQNLLSLDASPSTLLPDSQRFYSYLVPVQFSVF